MEVISRENTRSHRRSRAFQGGVVLGGMRRMIIWLSVLLAMAGANVCVADGSKLATGDVIGVIVDGEKDYSKTYQINTLGAISMSQVAPVTVAGLNTTDAAMVITDALKKVLRNPQVTVSFLERAKMQVFVVGQVKRSGHWEAGVGDRVLQVLAQAGYDDTADLSRVSIQRGNEVIDLDLGKYLRAEDLSVNVELQSGDTVVVPRSDSVGTVLVLGQVANPGAVSLRRGMTFREAMGLIGGTTVAADTDNVTVKREGMPESIKIDYKRAMDGDPSANVALQPQDAIYVPEIETAFFTIIGGVNRPGQYPVKGRLTLSEAVGLAGGPSQNVGDLRKVQLVRPSALPDGGNETTIFNLKDAMASGTPEPTVNRGDVIYVTEHKKKAGVLDVLQAILPLGWLLK